VLSAPGLDAAETPPVISQITVTGASALTIADARGATGLAEGDTYTTDQADVAMRLLLKAHADRGHHFANAKLATEPRLQDAVGVLIDIREGAPATVSRVQLTGISLLGERQARSLLGAEESGPYDADRWAAGINRLSDAYAQSGHPLARITLRLAAADEEEGDLALLVDVHEGPEIAFEAVTFEGMRKTRPGLLANMTRIRSGDRYDSRRVADARRRLMNSGLFASVHPVDILRGSDAGHVVYRARVTEARTARFLGVLGYAPPAVAGEPAQITGLVEGVETNILGTGRQARVRWESGENRTNRFAYREPFLFGRRVALDVEWDAERYQGSRTRAARSSLDWELASTVTVSVGGQAVSADDTSGRGALASVEFDTRDFRPNPLRGVLLRAEADAVTGGISFSRFETDARAFASVAGAHVLAARATVARVTGSDIPLTEWLFMGGADTLRGYEERQFRGTRSITGSVEYRIVTGRLSHVFAFVDVGRVSDADAAVAPKLGYGIGANLESRGGLVRFQYGIEPSASPLDGKVHLSLGTTL
jgi:outer membrane protein insertion porin family